MTQEEIKDEILKCKNNPYYFVTKYLVVKNHKEENITFSTPLSEKEFNNMVKKWKNDTRRIHCNSKRR